LQRRRRRSRNIGGGEEADHDNNSYGRGCGKDVG